ncbi:MAG: glycosyltransferase [Acidobacteriia bacterium]|nr:glycosyltransferase [Terriglobia bacterium]
MGTSAHTARLNKDADQITFTTERQTYWDDYATHFSHWARFRRYYRKRLEDIYSLLVPPGLHVLELGCANGDLLARLKPSYGVGVDLSSRMVELARVSHPGLNFKIGDAHDFESNNKYDYIIMSDLVNDLWDVQRVFDSTLRHSHTGTRVIINFYSRLWEWPRKMAEVAGIAKSQLPQNWLTVDDISNLLTLAGFEVIHKTVEILWPFRAFGISYFCNRYLVKLWPFRILGLTTFVVARPRPYSASRSALPRVSVIVPARNEAGNIKSLFERIPEMGAGTELIFVEGHSQDNTYERIACEIAARPGRNAQLFRQVGKGKGDAVRLGFAKATGDLFMILDADLTVSPEELPRFYEAWRRGIGEFINGVRLVYPMEERAMRFFNMVANKMFGYVFSWLLGQSVKDTLCGTKVLSRKDYAIIEANRRYFGDIDPFGDFDLLFGAARYSLKIIDVPIRYRERKYGETNIRRWKHGWLLLRMVLLASRRLRFV